MTVLYTELGRDAKSALLSCHKSVLSYCKYLEMDTLLHNLWQSLFACYAEIRFKITETSRVWWANLLSRIFVEIQDNGAYIYSYKQWRCVCVCVCVCRFVLVLSHSVMSDSEILWTIAHKDPLFMELVQARILDCFAISFSKWFSGLKNQTHLLCFLYCRWIFLPTEPWSWISN